jgi:hypothetical protein
LPRTRVEASRTITAKETAFVYDDAGERVIKRERPRRTV